MRYVARASTAGSATAWCEPGPTSSFPNTGGTSGCCATCSGSEAASGGLVSGRLAPLFQESLDLFDVLIADAFAAPVAATEAIQDVFPHCPRRFQSLRPVAASLQFPLEAPFTCPFLGAQEAALPRFWVGISPLDFDGHF